MFQELDFPVDLVKVPHPLHEGMIPKRKAIVRKDTGDVLNIVSDRYQLVRHLEVFEPINEAVTLLGIGVKNVAVRLGDKGASAKVIWTLDQQIKVAGFNGSSDLINVTVQARNSYDYSKMLGLQLGAFRLICSNGLTIGHLLHSYNKRHVRSLKVPEALERLTAMLSETNRVQAIWKDWEQIQYHPAQLSGWLELKPDTVSKRARLEIVDYFTRQPDRTKINLQPRFNGWEAYNAITWYGTHRVQTRSEERVLVAQEIMDQVAEQFAASQLQN